MPDHEHLNGWSKWSEYVLRTLESMVVDLKIIWDKQIRQEILLEQFEKIQSQIMERVKIVQEQVSADKEGIKAQLAEQYRTLDAKIDSIQAKTIERQDQIIKQTLGEKVKGQARQAAPFGLLIALWEAFQWIINNLEKIKTTIGG